MAKYDILIIGSGIGGLTTAIKIAEDNPELSVCVLTKTDEGESNTRYAQGGVAAESNTPIPISSSRATP